MPIWKKSNNILYTKWDKLNLCNYTVTFSEYFIIFRNHRRPYNMHSKKCGSLKVKKKKAALLILWSSTGIWYASENVYIF